MNVTTEKRCIARTANGNRCSRNKSSDSEYCKCHQKNLCFGVYNQKPPRTYYEQTAKKKKCGFIEDIDEFTLNRLNLNDNYTKVYFAMIEGHEYLVDEQNHLYTFNKVGKPKLNKVGFIDEDGNVNVHSTK
jgi:hypothetical protein